MTAKKARLNRQHRRRATAKLRFGPAAVRSHARSRPNGRKVRVKHF